MLASQTTFTPHLCLSLQSVLICLSYCFRYCISISVNSISLSLFISRCLSSSYTHTQHTPTHCTLVYGNCNEAMKHQIQLQSNSSATLSNKRKPGNSRPQIHFGWCMVVPPPPPLNSLNDHNKPLWSLSSLIGALPMQLLFISLAFDFCAYTHSHTPTHTHIHTFTGPRTHKYSPPPLQLIPLRPQSGAFPFTIFST